MLNSGRSIASRLSRVVVLAVLSGILVSVSFFLLNDFRQSLLAEKARLRSSAAAFAAAAAPALKIADERGVLLVLRGMREMPELRYAAASNTEGRIVAEIGQTAMLEGRDGAVDDKSLVSMFRAELLSVDVDVREGGEVVGSLTLMSSIASLKARYLAALSTSILFGLGLMAVTALIARAQIARVIRPLGELATEFADIGQRSDLTRRLANGRTDEVGVLIDAFNEMFGHIEKRDHQLQRHRENLEQTVEERTVELRLAKDDAERANAAKSDFLATMSHEIRTPMNGMMVMAEMLSAAPLAPKHLRYAEIIARSGRGLLNIINDILDFSKIEAGMLNLEAVPFSIDSAIEDTASLFAEKAREKGLTIALAIDPHVPGRVIGDPTRLTQVVGNLLNNALKFTDAGGVTIEVQQASTGTASCVLEIHVRDTGIGIAADKIDHIFERFSQADSSITRRFGGTGLGLAISRRLVQAMGGTLTVASTVGQGSDFSFRIELAAEAAQEVPMDLRGYRINAVTADAIGATALEKALRARGAEIVRDTAAGCDVVLVQAGCEAQVSPSYGAPLVLMCPFSSPTASGWERNRFAGEIALPLRRSELDALAVALKTGAWERFSERHVADALTARPPDLSHLKVLAVDDTAVNREVLAEALSGFGIVPYMAASGTQAIDMVRAGGFDVVFMDCSMPDMDGFEATAALRSIEHEEKRARAFVVALTAHVTGEEATRWHEAGMDAYVAKPFTIAQLARVLGEAGVIAERVTPAATMADSSLPPADGPEAKPLLSPATLAMFGALSSANGRSLADRVFGLFNAHAPQAFAQLNSALNGSPQEAAKLAHALKSMCLSAGAAKAGEECDHIEQRLKNEEPIAENDLSALKATLAASQAAMADHLARFISPVSTQA